MKELYGKASIFISASYFKSFGLTALEAMQVGLPIVSTNNGGQLDFIENNVNGRLVNVGDYESMANNIDDIIESKFLYDKYAQNNLKKLEDFKIENISRKFLEVMK